MRELGTSAFQKIFSMSISTTHACAYCSIYTRLINILMLYDVRYFSNHFAFCILIFYFILYCTYLYFCTDSHRPSPSPNSLEVEHQSCKLEVLSSILSLGSNSFCRLHFHASISCHSFTLFCRRKYSGRLQLTVISYCTKNHIIHIYNLRTFVQCIYGQAIQAVLQLTNLLFFNFLKTEKKLYK